MDLSFLGGKGNRGDGNRTIARVENFNDRWSIIVETAWAFRKSQTASTFLKCFFHETNESLFIGTMCIRILSRLGIEKIDRLKYIVVYIPF